LYSTLITARFFSVGTLYGVRLVESLFCAYSFPMLQYPIIRNRTAQGIDYRRKVDSHPAPKLSDNTIARQRLKCTLSAFDRGAYDGLPRDLRTRLRAHFEEALDLLENIAS